MMCNVLGQTVSVSETRCPSIPSSWQLLSHLEHCWVCSLSPPPWGGETCGVCATTECVHLQGSKSQQNHFGTLDTMKV